MHVAHMESSIVTSFTIYELLDPVIMESAQTAEVAWIIRSTVAAADDVIYYHGTLPAVEHHAPMMVAAEHDTSQHVPVIGGVVGICHAAHKLPRTALLTSDGASRGIRNHATNLPTYCGYWLSL